MEDQVAALTARGISAAFLGSAQSSAEVRLLKAGQARETCMVYSLQHVS
jgi:superfamily II DNA helicase RecQ